MDGQANSVALPREPGAMGAGNRTGIRKDRLAPSTGCSIFFHEELIAQRNIGVCLHVKCRGSHVCQFFSTLPTCAIHSFHISRLACTTTSDILLVAREPFTADHARSAPRAAVGDFVRRERRKQIGFQGIRSCYDSGSIIIGEEIVDGWPAGRAGPSRWLQRISDPGKHRLARSQSNRLSSSQIDPVKVQAASPP